MKVRGLSMLCCIYTCVCFGSVRLVTTLKRVVMFITDVHLFFITAANLPVLT